jgi:hypothetical protein
MMMVADLGPAHPAEKALGIVAMDAVAETVCLLMVDPVHREATVQLVPCIGFVGINLGAFSDRVPRFPLPILQSPYDRHSRSKKIISDTFCFNNSHRTGHIRHIEVECDRCLNTSSSPAARFIKAELKRADLTYEELAERLKEHGLSETRDSIAAKLKRGLTDPA